MKEYLQGRKILVAALCLLGGILCSKNAFAQDVATAKGIELVRKIEKGYPNMGGEVAEYLKAYPHSSIADRIRFTYASKLFNMEDYAAAGQIIEQTNPKSLTKGEQQEYSFKLGYCNLRSGNYDQAKRVLSTINNGKYHTPALYYLGYINYLEQDFEAAVPLFEKASKDRAFEQACRYNILESKFMLKDYEYVNTYGEEIYNSLENEYKGGAARILSESFYATENPQKARYYYQLYAVNAENITGKDNFYSGMIAYTLKSYKEAIEAFGQIASPADSLGQSALYHMGQCYIQLKNKHKAQEAFALAAQGNFDPGIKEDAFFNYAKLSFDTGKNIAPFEEYLSRFPASNTKWDEIHNYMATGFLMEQDYEKAISALNKVRIPGKQTARYLQKASFLRGLQLAQSNSYSMALEYFTKASQYGTTTGNTALTNLSEFWKAECLYRKDNFQGSLQILGKLLSNNSFKGSAEYPAAIWNSGYNHFKLGNYPAAIESFATYLALPGNKGQYTHEARLRLADSYFMNRNYSQAAETYTLIAQLEDFNNLYAPLQSAIAYGLLSEDTRKTEVLQKITAPENSSKKLYTQALYELGRTHVQNGQDKEALNVMERLMNNPPDSLFYHKALLEAGMINANKGNYHAAESFYKQIIEDRTVSEESQSALAGLENLYRQQNRAGEFLAYLDNIGLSETKTASERETMLFNSAEQVFLSGDYTAAINALQQFLEKYPAGAKRIQATFYMAESYNKLGKAEAAAQQYLKVMMAEGMTEDAFTEIATLNYGKLSYQLQKYKEAARAFESLQQIAKLGNNRMEGILGKMRSNYNLQEYRSAISACDEATQNNIPEEYIAREIKYIKAKSLYATNARDEAAKLFGDLSKDPQDKYGAESAYLLILDAYDEGEFE